MQLLQRRKRQARRGAATTSTLPAAISVIQAGTDTVDPSERRTT